MPLEDTFIIPVNSGRPKVVDPYIGMTLSDFDLVAKEGYELDLCDKRPDSGVAELTYYFNLWNDSLRHGAKTGAEPCFDSFMGAVARGDC